MNFDLTNFTSPSVIIGVVVALILIIAAIAIAAHQRKKTTERLRSRFGSEYDLALRQSNARRNAETKLIARVERVHHLSIRHLSAVERDRYLVEWQAVQSRFIDHPRGAVTEADELINSIMLARGYPVAAFEQRAADLSVDYSRLVEPYRSANAVAVRAGGNEATTEELRTAMIHYRALVDELLQVKTPAQTSVLV